MSFENLTCDFSDIRLDIAQHGFSVIPVPFSSALFAQLQVEALSRAETATLFFSKVNPHVRKFLAELGNSASDFANGPWISQFLFDVFGERFQFVQSRSGLTFMDSGCVIGRHKDTIDGLSNATVIVYLFHRSSNFGTGERLPELTKLDVYLEGSGKILALETPEKYLAVGRGNLIDHGRSMICGDQVLISLNLSYRNCSF